ncbi:hypothetical protein P152DRAFT_435204 [Eremomyces bilateralis CBS 781.70]|uniref:Uncharacterized protein n=1 Tax=Eremomyces bilateralis CBS 781.70 TaxID=1392243 RepID=A0A6G1G4P1_9PEZI|nr:uncharacterized protein P152DRAFT_435204 [Eremomyces bilateralis CBS 781.70]KAF1812911.1 hypothetical protein P152DRAFT_435204 [Eremomyces bilateralis CBS 781.70]
MASAYKLYRVEYKLALQDPEFKETRYHNVIFVETGSDGSGYKHHVNGDVVSETGMTYLREMESKPDLLETFHAVHYLGWVTSSSYPEAFDALLRSLPTPPRQRRFNIQTMKYERCGSDGAFYGPDEIAPPLVKCTEWTHQTAIPALLQKGLIQTSEFSQST